MFKPTVSIPDSAPQVAENPVLQPVASTPDEMRATPYLDHAADILAADPTLDNETRAIAYDRYHVSANPEELIHNLGSLQIPDSTRRSLMEAKRVTAPVQSPVDNVVSALTKMQTIPPKTLALGEKYPTVTKALISAAQKD
jgi:hypothetical protein